MKTAGAGTDGVRGILPTNPLGGHVGAGDDMVGFASINARPSGVAQKLFAGTAGPARGSGSWDDGSMIAGAGVARFWDVLSKRARSLPNRSLETREIGRSPTQKRYHIMPIKDGGNKIR